MWINLQVKGNPTKQESETITSIWQTGLYNSHIHCDRYPLDDNRYIFMFKVWVHDKWWNWYYIRGFGIELSNQVNYDISLFLQDGSIAWEAKDFLIDQEECLEVTIEQKTYHGKHTEAYKLEQKEASKSKSTKKDKKKTTKKKKSKKDEL